MRKLGVLVLFGILLFTPSTALAIPMLQLYFDPALNPGAFYDPVDEGWETNGDPVILTAFMHGLPLSDTYTIFASLPGFAGNPNTSGVNLGFPTTWSGPSNPGLPPHGVYPSWWTPISFMFTPANAFTVFNTQDGTGAVAGYRRDFFLDFSHNLFFHFDLVDRNSFDEQRGRYREFAPFSHDAQRNPGEPPRQVPEPSSVVLLSLGMALMTRRLRRTR